MAGGGGTAYCTVEDSDFKYNSSGTGGGGGAYYSILKRCRFFGNLASGGGATAHSDLFNCLAATNSAILGGGIYSGTMVNCTVVNNSASDQGGGTYRVTATNSIVLLNTAPTGWNHHDSSFAYTMATPLAAGPGNMEQGAGPLFVQSTAGNFRLANGSAAVNAGLNSAVPAGDVDLDGRPRIDGSAVDFGAYELQSAFRTWMGSYGLNDAGLSEFADPDGDRANNWEEWVARTSPTDSASRLRVTDVRRTGYGISLTWLAAPGRVYTVERTASLTGDPVFSIVQDDLTVSAAQSLTIIDDTTPPPSGAFYRVRARLQ
jgi:hypothetical protein